MLLFSIITQDYPKDNELLSSVLAKGNPPAKPFQACSPFILTVFRETQTLLQKPHNSWSQNHPKGKIETMIDEM